MEISKEQLSKLRDKLPNGAQSKIAETEDFSLNYVNMVLNGKVDITDSNKRVITAALKIVNENKIENQLISEQLKNL